jgi:hypothetical protein
MFQAAPVSTLPGPTATRATTNSHTFVTNALARPATTSAGRRRILRQQDRGLRPPQRFLCSSQRRGRRRQPRSETTHFRSRLPTVIPRAFTRTIIFAASVRAKSAPRRFAPPPPDRLLRAFEGALCQTLRCAVMKRLCNCDQLRWLCVLAFLWNALVIFPSIAN